MRVLLTGGMGFIGSHTAVSLLEAGHEPILYDNLSNADRSVVDRIGRITGHTPTFIEGDIRDGALLKQVLRNEHIEAVIHFAGLKAVGESVGKPLEYFDNNVSGTIKLLEAMRSVFSPGFAAIRSLLPVLGTIRQIDFSFCKYSSRYDHFKEGIIENAFHPALSNAALMDIGVYCVHPLVSLFGMPASIQSSSIFLSNGFEGAGTVLLQYTDMQATLRYSKISDSYLPSQIQGEAATLLIDKIQDPQQLTLLFRDGHTENPNIPAVSNNMVYEAAEFARLIDQLQQALENDSTDGIPSLIRHSWLKASCLELEIMDTVRRQQKILFPADH